MSSRPDKAEIYYRFLCNQHSGLLNKQHLAKSDQQGQTTGMAYDLKMSLMVYRGYLEKQVNPILQDIGIRLEQCPCFSLEVLQLMQTT